jgi:hypothetical protein
MDVVNIKSVDTVVSSDKGDTSAYKLRIDELETELAGAKTEMSSLDQGYNEMAAGWIAEETLRKSLEV